MRVLLLNQCFYPDVVSTAQHLTDLAVELTAEGHRVTVIASRRGYDNPELEFPAQETYKGIRIIRIPTLGLGKSAKWRRAADFASFLICCVLRLLLLPRYDAVVALTSPPLISLLGALFTKLKGGRFYFWVMDLNPDEAVAAGWLRETSATAKVLQALLRYSLRQAERIFVLDRFMKERIQAKGITEDRLLVIAPWAHDDAIRYDEQGREAFRAEHGLTDKFVVMYSGNHSPCHPLDTLLLAAEQLASRSEILFCFVGGGSEQLKVERFAGDKGLANIKCLPYQPMAKLAGSLSAADLHVVVMGAPFRGIVHPCKVYNILAIGTPFLYIGPAESHVADLISQLEPEASAYSAPHGAVTQVVAQIRSAAAGTVSRQSAQLLAAEFSQSKLLPRMIAALAPEPETLLQTATPTTKPSIPTT